MASPTHRQYKISGPGGVWDRRFYQDLVNRLHEQHPGKPIRLFSETRRSEDLQGLKNCKVCLGDKKNFKQHFNSLVSSEYMVPCSSSFSTWAVLIRRGTPLIHNQKYIKHFSYNSEPEGMVLAS